MKLREIAVKLEFIALLSADGTRRALYKIKTHEDDNIDLFFTNVKQRRAPQMFRDVLRNDLIDSRLRSRERNRDRYICT